MATFSDLKARAAYLAQVAGAKDTQQPAPDWAALVQAALVDFSWEVEWNQEQVTFQTVVNQAEYAISGNDFRAMKYAAYGTLALEKTSEDDEYRRDPVWYLAAAATPQRFYNPSANVVRLVPTPVQGGVTVTVRGTRVAPAFTSDTDSPSCPDTYHEALALRAAWLYSQNAVTGELDAAVVDSYNKQYLQYIETAQNWQAQERYSGQLVRKVSRPCRPRVHLRGYFSRY
jgi:hypothetical protein